MVRKPNWRNGSASEAGDQSLLRRAITKRSELPASRKVWMRFGSSWQSHSASKKRSAYQALVRLELCFVNSIWPTPHFDNFIRHMHGTCFARGEVLCISSCNSRCRYTDVALARVEARTALSNLYRFSIDTSFDLNRIMARGPSNSLRY